VINPNTSHFKHAIVGAAMPQKMGKRAQYRMAELSARRQFSSIQRISIQSFQVAQDGSNKGADFSSHSKLSSGGLLNFSQLKKVDEWHDPDSQELFILYGLIPDNN